MPDGCGNARGQKPLWHCEQKAGYRTPIQSILLHLAADTLVDFSFLQRHVSEIWVYLADDPEFFDVSTASAVNDICALLSGWLSEDFLKALAT
jgi:hypothetical protein